MQALGQFVKKAEYARMHGWDRSYVTKLERQGRIVLNQDGLVDWAASDALIGKTSDPSKLGVQERWAAARAEKGADEPAPSGPAQAAATSAAPAASATGGASAFHDARANREHYNGQMARLEYEWVTGMLVNRARVEDAAHTIGRSVRDRVLGLAPRIAPELAAISDPWELEQRLTAALRQVLDDVSKQARLVMRDVDNDPARGKLAELVREGRERYGIDREHTAAP